jgi:hypothetical protein
VVGFFADRAAVPAGIGGGIAGFERCCYNFVLLF